jgi:glycosyltransferase involved in cell wall biosynthesis
MLRFSVITPAYHAQSFLPDLALNLLQQEVKDWEWLVIADDLQTELYETLLRPFIGKKLTISHHSQTLFGNVCTPSSA